MTWPDHRPLEFGGHLFASFCTDCLRSMGESFSPFCPDCGAMVDVEYDLGRVELRADPNPYVRFRDLLPVRDPALLPEARFTPTVHAVTLGERVGLPWLYLKDEARLPTGTTKDRMAAVGLPYLFEGGVRQFCTSSTGNSSTSYARAIARVPELVMHVFTAAQFASRIELPDTDQVVSYLLEDATFVEAFDAARHFAEAHGHAAERGFFNPGRREGLKVAFLEASDQVPRPIDWYVQAVSSAMGVYGTCRAADQLRAIGRIDRLPRLLCVQQDSCAPMVSAWRDGSEHIRRSDIVDRPVGIAQAILRGNPTAPYPPVRTRVVATGGSFTAVSERQIRQAREWVEADEGLSPCFSAAAALAGVIAVRQSGRIDPGEVILVNLTGSDRPPAPPDPRAHVLVRTDTGWTERSTPMSESRVP